MMFEEWGCPNPQDMWIPVVRGRAIGLAALLAVLLVGPPGRAYAQNADTIDEDAALEELMALAEREAAEERAQAARARQRSASAGNAPCSPKEQQAIETLFPQIVATLAVLDLDEFGRLIKQLDDELGPRCEAAIAARAQAGAPGRGGGEVPGFVQEIPGGHCAGGVCCDATGCY